MAEQIIPQKIIIDTDPGQDDAFAILLALGSPELQILGITTVAGNVPLRLTTLNARKICELAGRPEVAIYVGCDRPLQAELVTAEHVHGSSGLDGHDLPDPVTAVQAQHAVDFIIETLRREAPGSVTLCPLGPLTNIATALQRAPDIAARIARIVLMGGGFFEGGNITPAAEFNIFVDPEAAAIVFAAGIPLTVLPLDATHQALTNPARIAAIRGLGSRLGEVAADWLEFFERYDVEKYGSSGGPLHDPNVIAWLLRPDLYKGRDCNVEIETASPLTRGMTVVDWWGVTERKPNATWIRDVDAEGFFALLTERLARLG